MVKPPIEVELEWKSGFRFDGRSAQGVVPIDGDGEAGASPMTLLLLALASCTGSDVADILRTGRQPLEGLRVEARGERRQEPLPHRYTRIRLVFRMEGAVERPKAERAVRLSLDTYCSVLHTLADDLELEWEVWIEGRGPDAEEPGGA